MSIIHDLYTIYDREFARYRARNNTQNRLLIEMRRNLDFLREGLRESLPASHIVHGLESAQFDDACAQGLNLNRLQKKALARTTFGGIREFERYAGWTTARLVETVYERIATLKKLAAGGGQVDLPARLRNLFKLLFVVLAHIEQQPLPPRDKP